jgi:hypothetical protein
MIGPSHFSETVPLRSTARAMTWGLPRLRYDGDEGRWPLTCDNS